MTDVWKTINGSKNVGSCIVTSLLLAVIIQLVKQLIKSYCNHIEVGPLRINQSKQTLYTYMRSKLAETGVSRSNQAMLSLKHIRFG